MKCILSLKTNRKLSDSKKVVEYKKAVFLSNLADFELLAKSLIRESKRWRLFLWFKTRLT